jgi:hypothetical protein
VFSVAFSASALMPRMVLPHATDAMIAAAAVRLPIVVMMPPERRPGNRALEAIRGKKRSRVAMPGGPSTIRCGAPNEASPTEGVPHRGPGEPLVPAIAVAGKLLLSAPRCRSVRTVEEEQS